MFPRNQWMITLLKKLLASKVTLLLRKRVVQLQTQVSHASLIFAVYAMCTLMFFYRTRGFFLLSIG